MAVRTAARADRQQVARLLERNDLTPHDEAHWERLWSSNPAVSGSPTDPPIGWVLETEPGHIVGYLGNVALQYDFGGRTLAAAATHAWAVDVDYRNRAILLVQAFLRQQGVDLLLNTTANYEASRVFDALRIPRVPSRDYDISLSWSTSAIGLADSILRHRRIPLAGVLRYPAGIALALRRHRRGPGRAATPGIRQLEFSDPGFDALVDGFWNALRQDSPRILAHRDARSLRWRFGEETDRTRLYAYEPPGGDGKIAAWALVQDQDNAEIGLRRRRLVDLQTNVGTDAIAPLLRRALADCRRDDVHMLEAIGFSGVKRARLEELSERERRLPAWMFFWQAPDPELAEALAHAEAWDPCFYDGDGVL